MKTEKELFDIKEEEEIQEIVKPVKKTRGKREMSVEEKQALIERLRAGKERKRAERAKKTEKNVTLEVKDIEGAPVKRSPKVTITHPSSDKNELADEIAALRKEIRETKEKHEVYQLKAELKELRKLMAEQKKDEEPKKIEAPKKVQEPPKKVETPKQQPSQPKPTAPPTPKIIKKRLR